MGFVYYSNAFVYFEVGRTELIRSTGISYRQLEDRGYFLPVTRAEARFLRPAQYDDCLRVRTWIASVGPVRLTFAYEIVRDPDGARILEGATELACTARDGRPVRLPADVAAAAKALAEPSLPHPRFDVGTARRKRTPEASNRSPAASGRTVHPESTPS